MEAAVRARKAGRQAVRDVSPDPLRERIYDLLDASAMVPGVLALTSARAVESGNGAGSGKENAIGNTTGDGTGNAAGDRTGNATGNATGDGVETGTGDPAGATGESSEPSGGRGTVGVEERAAGVQLIYEGLGLTRALAREPPWERDPPHTGSNIDVLAADVMVARGFSLLARTEAADKAVETVQSFGEDQTDDQQGRTAPTHALETDVFELAVLAGTTAFGVEPADALLSYATELATSLDGDHPEPPESVPKEVEQAMAGAPNPRQFHPAEDPRPSATDP